MIIKSIAIVFLPSDISVHSIDGITFTWKNGRRMESSTVGSIVTTYDYDIDGNRVERNGAGYRRKYTVIDGVTWGEQITFGGKTHYMEYMRDENGEVYGFIYDRSTYFLEKNALGDVKYLLDASGNVLAKYTYDEWGKKISVTDENGNLITDGTNIAHLNPFRYRSYYYDDETGLYYLNSRYYDPCTGRFVNADSILDNRGVNTLNMFAYCGNNPINNKDSNGHIFGTICGALIGGVIGGIGGAISAALGGKSIIAGAVTGAATGAIIGGACGFIADTFGTGAIALAAGAAICGVVAAAGNVVNQYWNYKIEKKDQANNANINSTNNSKTPRSSNGKLASECESFAEYVDAKSIVVSGVTAAVFAPLGIGANCIVNSAFAGGLETGLINRTAQVIANFALGGNISIIQAIIDLM